METIRKQSYLVPCAQVVEFAQEGLVCASVVLEGRKYNPVDEDPFAAWPGF